MFFAEITTLLALVLALRTRLSYGGWNDKIPRDTLYSFHFSLMEDIAGNWLTYGVHKACGIEDFNEQLTSPYLLVLQCGWLTTHTKYNLLQIAIAFIVTNCSSCLYLTGMISVGINKEISVGVLPFRPITLDQAIGLARLQENRIGDSISIYKSHKEKALGWDAENDEGLGVKVHEIDTLSSMEMVIDSLMTLICKDGAIEVQKMRLQLQEDKKAMTGRLEQYVNAMDCSWRGLKPKMHLGIKTLVQWTFIQNTGVSSLVHQCIHGLYLNFAFIKIFRED